jgi:two-component system, NtrC family, sensor kinase
MNLREIALPAKRGKKLLTGLTVLGLGLIAAFSALLVLVILPANARHESVRQSARMAEETIAMVSRNLTLTTDQGELVKNDSPAVKRILDSLLTLAWVEGYFLFDLEGRQVMSARHQHPIQPDKDEVLRVLQIRVSSIRNVDVNRLFVTEMLKVGGIDIGLVQLAVDNRLQLQRISGSLTLALSYFVMTFILFMAAILVFVNFRLLRPLKRLSQNASKMAKGEKATVSGGYGYLGDLTDSIYVLGKALNSASEEKEKAHKTVEQLQEQLDQADRGLYVSERLATLGRLSSGLAHEIGNPLTAIKGYLEILVDGELDETDRDFVERSLQECARIDEIIRRLLDYARPEQGKQASYDLGQMIEQSLSFIRGQKYFREIELELNLNDELPMVSVDAGQMKQVLVNLAVNAADAMQGVGKLTITAKGANFSNWGEFAKEEGFSDNAVKAGRGFKSGERVAVILFRDNGSGIPHDILHSIFDPFFSTKEPGRGTGLGLAISASIINFTGGAMIADSLAGEGATFCIILPVVEDKDL